jgi:hypothetical protein
MLLIFHLASGIVFGKLFQSVFVASIEAVSVISIPYGNDVHFPSVFGKRQASV